MNRIYKVIWNEALNCFTAVGEYAKGRGKSSKSSVSSNATINTTSNASSINRLRLSAIGIGLIAAGFTMSPQVFAATGVGGGVEIGTASNCSTAASAGKTDSVAVGCNSVADLSSDLAVTFYQRNNPDNTGVDTSTAFNSTAIGTGAVATEAGTSLGMNASSSNLGIALGIQSKSENVAAIAIGPAALARGNTSLALGRQSAATEDFAQAIGNVSSATGKGSLAMGHSARAEGYRSIAIGSADINGADATGTQSGVVYQTNEQTLAKGKDSMAFGSGAQSLLEDSVALGSNSTANVGGNVGGYVPTGVNGTAILATKSTTGAVSVGRVASGNEAAVRRQIVNLAAGTNDSDAVNVAQLKGGISSVIDLGLDFTGDNTATTVTRNLGEKLTVKGGATTVLSDNNIGVVADNMSNTLTIKLAKNLTGLDSADIGGINVSSTGIDANSTRITNVASGVGDDYNAANIGDLNKAVADNKTKYYSVKSGATGNKNNDGAQGSNSMAMGGNASATGGQAIAIGSGESGQNTVASGQQSIAIGANTVSKGHSSIAIGGDDLDAASMVSGVNALFNTYTGSTGGLVTVGDYSNHTESGGAASVAIGVKAHSKGNLSTAVGVHSSSSGDASSAFGMGSSATKKGSVALGAGSTTLTDATYQDKLTIGNKDYLYAGETNDKGAQISVGSERRERQIKHVASGEVSVSSTDAINGSQLHATNESVKDLSTTVVANKTHFYSVNSTDSTRGNYNNNGATGVDAMAAGIDASATGENATALGTKSNAEGTRSTAIGYQAQAKDRNAIALGYQANAHQKHSTAIGYAANAGYAAIAIGDAATATKKGSTAIGSQSVSTDVYSTALGREAKALEKNTVAVGYSTTASGESSVAIGDGAKARGVNSIAIGTGNIVNGDNSGAFGDPNIISGSGSYAVGNNNTIDADNSFVLGNNVTINASDKYSIALGEGAVINGEDSIAIGRGATAAASTRNGLAIGVRSSSGNHAASLGDDATSGNYAVALGSKSTAQIGGTAIGRDSSAVSNATALGREAIAGQSGNVALGHQSITALQHIGAFAINNQPVAGLTSGANTVSVGTVGAERQIQNVAPGVVDATSTDAINGSQLFATNEAIDVLSGTVIANKTKYYSVKSGATGNKNNDGAQGSNSMAMGGNASATGGQAIAIGSGESGQNTVASGQQSIAIGANVVSSGNSSIAIGGDDLDAASKVNGVNALFDTYTGSTGGLVTVGDYSNHTESNGAASVAIGVKAQSSGNLSTAVGVRSSSSGDASSAFGMGSSATKKGSVALGAGSVANRAGGLAGYIPTGVSLADADAITNTQSGAISGAVSVGSGAKGGNRQIINLAAGTNDSDAVNVAQLKGGISSVIDLGLDFTGDTGTATRKLGQTLSITGGATSDLTTANIGVEADETGGLVVKLAEKVNLGADGSVTTGNTLVNNDGLTIAGGPSFTTSGIDAGDQQIKGVLSGGLLTDVNNELNAANIGDIKTAIGDVTTLGFGIKAADNNEVQKNLGQTVDIIGSNSNLTTQIDNGKVEVVLNNNLDLDTNGSIKMGSSSSLPLGLGPVTNVNRFGMTTGNALAGTSINLTGVTVASPFGITNLNSTGLYVVGGPSVTTNGINAGNRKIVNVDDGSNDKDAVNFGQLKNFSAAARTKVVKGSNVDSVDFSIDSNTGQDVYTVNANGTSVSSGDDTVLTVTAGDKGNDNITDYKVDLSDKTKTSLSHADSAIQTLITQVDGADDKTLTKTDNKANFASGDNILLTRETDGSIKVATKDNVEFKKVTVKDGADSSVVEATKITVGGANPVTINGATGTVNGLTNKTWNGTTIVSGQAATEDQLQLASTALVNKGMKFVGNDGQVISRMLGETLGVEGGMTTGASSAANTKTVKKDNGTLEIQMAKNLTDLDSIMINNGGPIISSTGIDMGSNADEEGYPTNTITNLGKGVNGTDAVNLDQLNNVTTDLTDLGFDITADNASLAPGETKDKVKLGDTVKYTSADGSIVTTVADNEIDFALGDNLSVGGPGLDDEDGVDGFIGVNGADGQSGIALNGADGTIGLTGPTGASGTIGVINGVLGVNGVNGEDGITRIVIDDIQVATMEDGMKFAGNTGATIAKQLNETLNIEGTLANSADASGANLRVDSDNGKLNLMMAKNLTDLDSIMINNGGPIISSTGIDMGSNADEEGYPTNTITNLGKGVNGTDAVNLDQLNNVTTDLTDLGFDITADNASLAPGETKDKVKLGDTVKYTSADGSIVTTVADNEIDFALGDNLSVGGPGLDDEDGVDGFIGVNGADGQSGIALNGADGTIGLTGPAAIDGVSPTLTMRPEIRPGDVFDDDTDVTRLSYEDGDGNSNTIATLEDDGLRFSGNDNPTVGYVTRNLNKEMQIVGSKTAIGTYSSGNINTIATQDGGIEIQMADSPKFGEVIINAENTGKITGLAAGEDDTDAVNVYQLNQTNSTINQGLDFGGDSGTDVNRKLGQKLTVKGGDTMNADPATKNISVTANGTDTLTIRLDKDINLGNTGSVTTGNTQVNNAGITLYNGDNNQVALTNNGLNNGKNKITNVADGLLSATSKDAVNGSQLFKTNNEVAKGIKIGDGNSDNDQQFSLGDTINVTGDNNLTTVASATGVQVKLNNQLDLGDAGSIQIGNSIMSNAGFTFVDNGMGRTVRLSSTGLDNGGNTIRNVGRGELNSDAVNVGQLREVTIALDRGWDITAQGDVATQVRQGDAIDLNSRDGNIKVSRTLVNNGAALDANTGLAAVPASANDISFDLNPDISVVSVTAGDTTINDDGLTIAGGPSITKSGIDAADNKVTNVQNGEVTAESQDAINGSQLYAQGTGISSIIGGNTVYNPDDGTFTNSNIGGTGQSNIDGAIASIRQGTIEINENVQVNTTNITNNTTDIAANTTNIATNTSNIMTNTANITTNTTNIKTNTDRLDAGLNFGADSGATINKPVGDESVLSFTGGNNITTTAEGSSIKFDLNGNISVDSVTAGNTVINSSGITMQDGPSMTAQGLYAGNQRLTGVADGIEPKDAVNYSQLSALDSRLNNNMNDLGYRIDEVEDDANAGISAAMAMSALPQAFISGKSLIGGGVSTYNGESAVAIGFSKLSNDGRWVIKVNGTADTQGNVGGAVGAGFHFD